MIQSAYAAMVPPTALSWETVLVVEDEAMVCEIAAEALADEGYRVLTAADAVEAERILQAERVDMLFTDIDLARNTNGVALARDARRHCPRLPVVYTSGGRHTLPAGEAVTGSVFVPKPYRPSQIVALANRILGH
ncbi:Response regulator receiver domain-containing protein [Methylobacterium sp. ap11]|uniref:response regulator n=1 Tax=Methylobacterium sp. ap11 TaxID=1761799 RepID=UPI0008C6E9E8|nr:response regulator [Methylobacterium sp. ap11]SEP20842.1 Response regulator receiver domain-containing protein [Methylobacterium sp. ap11]